MYPEPCDFPDEKNHEPFIVDAVAIMTSAPQVRVVARCKQATIVSDPWTLSLGTLVHS